MVSGMTEEAGWRVDNPHEALHPSALGFSGVQDVVTHALEHLWRSQALFDAKIQAGKEESGNMKVYCIVVLFHMAMCTLL